MKRPVLITLCLVVALLPVLSAAIAFGSVSLPLSTTFRVLSRALFALDQTDSTPILQIVLNLRLPQALAAFVVGGGFESGRGVGDGAFKIDLGIGDYALRFFVAQHASHGLVLGDGQNEGE